MKMYEGVDISIPEKTNAVICVIAPAISIAFLYVASHTESIAIMVLCAIGFSFSNNTIFALLHDATHMALFKNKRVNNLVGQYLATFFPSGFTFQRVCHINHHRNNRTDNEMFEAYYPNDNKFMKTVQWYGLLLGFYWHTYVIGWLLLVFVPYSTKIIAKNDAKNRMKHTGANQFAKVLGACRTPYRLRLELLLTFVVVIGVFYLLDLSLGAVLLCYWAFSVNWGALQYADHAYSKRDIRYGAWNLKVPKPIEMVFLNYHHHAAHHIHPHVSWKHLPHFVKEEEQVSFWKIYMKMWKGPVLTEEKSPNPLDVQFDNLLANGLEASAT